MRALGEAERNGFFQLNLARPLMDNFDGEYDSLHAMPEFHEWVERLEARVRTTRSRLEAELPQIFDPPRLADAFVDGPNG